MDKDVFVGLGDRLREERVRLGMDQTEFGALGKVSKNSQWNYEKGERTPDAAYLEAIAAAGVDVLYVLTGQRTPEPSGLTVSEEKMLENYRALRDEDRAAVQRLTDSLAESGQQSLKEDHG